MKVFMKGILRMSVFLAMGSAMAKPIPISPTQFQSRDFVKAFIGSYGFLSPVEPKVDTEEAELLVDLQELFGQGRYAEVEKRLSAFIRERRQPIDPEAKPKDVSPAMIFMLGNYYFQSDRIKEAERAYRIAIDRFPSFRRAHKNLAMLHASSGDMDKAFPHLKKAIELGDADHRSYGLLGYTYLLKKRPMAAEGAYRQAFLLNPDEKDWKLGLAQALLLQENWAAAASLLGELINESPGNVDLWKRQANCYIEMNQKLRAAANFEVLRRKGLADVETLDRLGNIYVVAEQPMLALGAYLAAMKKSPTVDVKRSLRTARILVDFGAGEEATKYIKQVREHGSGTLQNSDLVELLLVEVAAARLRKDPDRMGELLDRVLEIDRGHGEALVQRGVYLGQLALDAPDPDGKKKLYTQARTSFRMALEKPEVAYQANLRYGQMLVRRGQAIEALTYLKAALEEKESDNLKQYIRRVERAAARQKVREEREAKERAEAEAKARESAAKKEEVK
tara:strand:- start:25896 stop:27416 length:1521 start_codon:yes stop_codon:yes gene_type:complete